MFVGLYCRNLIKTPSSLVVNGFMQKKSLQAAEYIEGIYLALTPPLWWDRHTPLET